MKKQGTSEYIAALSHQFIVVAMITNLFSYQQQNITVQSSSTGSKVETTTSSTGLRLS